MIKPICSKIRVFLLPLALSVLIGVSVSPVANAATDDNGNTIIEEADIRQTPQQIQQKKDRESRDNLIKISVIIFIIIVGGSIVYLNRGKLSIRNGHRRKK